jgi:hypothetical protein
MHIPVNAIRIAQRHLRDGGFDPGPLDGQLGPQTEAALGLALAARRGELAPAHAGAILGGSRRRKVTAYVQLLARDAGIESGPVDGFWGPQTDFAFGELEHLEQFGELPHPWRDFPGPAANPNGWPVETEAALRDLFGEPAHPPLVRIAAPYPLRLSWDLGTTVTRIGCHEKVAASLERVLAGVLAHYGPDGVRELRLDRYGGCFNPRKKRGGTSWSTHAWAIALDFDPERNRLQWGRERAAFARPEYHRWWELWEEEGWVSLGRVANFDWMHVQAARRAPH